MYTIVLAENGGKRKKVTNDTGLTYEQAEKTAWTKYVHGARYKREIYFRDEVNKGRPDLAYMN